MDNVASLHTDLIDSRNGYTKALEIAGDTGMTGLFGEMIALRNDHSATLAKLLEKGGKSADAQGSFMTTVHKSVMSFQSLFGDLSERILPGLIDGEKRILKSYDEALASGGLTGDVQVELKKQIDVVHGVIAKMQDRYASYEAANA